ncbi:nucleoside-diphosphate-sugar epimerase [Gillisia mitskevichiae]|uniref:Nucleoside-diphosphate-sugar epimerase n=1 Tax=Gillisia mitskevichiae TaxID=270921 RepID=A0A495PZA2_9FLAO|nr:SDR family NAD(P)-dependent oxidoreductase [Gillisia mitskevichiae]RKS55790.1 nucleoside-diphosphate-sugar epimerase [Gillisia mitskevichiae]
MNISILGCGWLGLPLAKKLIEAGHIVKGSTTNRDKINLLSSEGIIPYKIQLFEEGVQGDMTSFLNESEVLIIDIPPGLRKDPEVNFVGKIERLKSYLEKARIEKVLFVSATSVYEDTEDFPEYTEEESANGNAENARQLIGAEELLKASDRYATSIIRFGGLIGPGRHPVNYLSGKSDLQDPAGPVNLIHLDDCIGIITAILEKKAWGETFHGVYPEHPTRKEYYSRVAKEKGLASMSFNEDSVSRGKIINSVKVDEILGYEFKTEI